MILAIAKAIMEGFTHSLQQERPIGLGQITIKATTDDDLLNQLFFTESKKDDMLPVQQEKPVFGQARQAVPAFQTVSPPDYRFRQMARPQHYPYFSRF